MRARRPLYVLIATVLLVSNARAAQLYEIVTETVMPHLEENLRYATTREQRCLAEDELWTAFPVLQYAALKDCQLEQELRNEDSVSYALVCEGGHGTTGRATWQLARAQSVGTLNVKLGGKNMTFSQRVTATALGACGRASRRPHDREGAPFPHTSRSVAVGPRLM